MVFNPLFLPGSAETNSNLVAGNHKVSNSNYLFSDIISVFMNEFSERGLGSAKALGTTSGEFSVPVELTLQGVIQLPGMEDIGESGSNKLKIENLFSSLSRVDSRNLKNNMHTINEEQEFTGSVKQEFHLTADEIKEALLNIYAFQKNNEKLEIEDPEDRIFAKKNTEHLFDFGKISSLLNKNIGIVFSAEDQESLLNISIIKEGITENSGRNNQSLAFDEKEGLSKTSDIKRDYRVSILYSPTKPKIGVEKNTFSITSDTKLTNSAKKVSVVFSILPKDLSKNLSNATSSNETTTYINKNVSNQSVQLTGISNKLQPHLSVFTYKVKSESNSENHVTPILNKHHKSIFISKYDPYIINSQENGHKLFEKFGSLNKLGSQKNNIAATRIRSQNFTDYTSNIFEKNIENDESIDRKQFLHDKIRTTYSHSTIKKSSLITEKLQVKLKSNPQKNSQIVSKSGQPKPSNENINIKTAAAKIKENKTTSKNKYSELKGENSHSKSFASSKKVKGQKYVNEPRSSKSGGPKLNISSRLGKKVANNLELPKVKASKDQKIIQESKNSIQSDSNDLNLKTRINNRAFAKLEILNIKEDQKAPDVKVSSGEQKIEDNQKTPDVKVSSGEQKIKDNQKTPDVKVSSGEQKIKEDQKPKEVKDSTGKLKVKDNPETRGKSSKIEVSTEPRFTKGIKFEGKSSSIKSTKHESIESKHISETETLRTNGNVKTEGNSSDTAKANSNLFEKEIVLEKIKKVSGESGKITHKEERLSNNEHTVDKSQIKISNKDSETASIATQQVKEQKADAETIRQAQDYTRDQVNNNNNNSEKDANQDSNNNRNTWNQTETKTTTNADKVSNTSFVMNSEDTILENVKHTVQSQKIIKATEIFKEVTKFIRKQDTQTLVLKLEPEHLGQLKIKLDLSQQALKAFIEVESEVVKKMLESNLSELHTQINKNGIELSSVNISLSSSDQKSAKYTNGKKRSGAAKKEKFQTEDANHSKVKLMGYNTYEFLA